MALNVKKGDTVLVIAGKDKGKTGKVLVAMPADDSVVVAGVNIIAKHKKPRSANDKGGIIKKEGKINASNVQVVCPACNKATRIAHQVNGDEKIRVCKKCGANLDVAPKKTTKEAPKTTKKVETAPKAEKVEQAAEKKPATKTTATAEKKTTTKSTAAKSTSTKTTKSTTKKVESK